jgi:hypothetical protein
MIRKEIMKAQSSLMANRSGFWSNANLATTLCDDRSLTTLVSMVVLLTLTSVTSCRRKPQADEETRVSSDDIKIGYSSLDKQMEEIGKFSHLILQEKQTDNPDAILKEIMEHAGLRNIKVYLEELLQKPSGKSSPNPRVLFERIRQMQALDDSGASEFIQKLKDEKNVDGLCVALYGLRTRSLEARAADALAELGDRNAVHILTIRLFHAGCTSSGGIGVQATKKRVRWSLIKALESCTDLTFPDYDASPDATFQAVKRCEDWLAKNASTRSE